MNRKRAPIEERLAIVLEDVLGFPVCSTDISPNRGYWSHGHQDVCRWEATIPVPRDREAEEALNSDPKVPWRRVYREVMGERRDHVMLMSWDVMSACVKHGVTLEKEDLHFLVHAREAKMS